MAAVTSEELRTLAGQVARLDAAQTAKRSGANYVAGDLEVAFFDQCYRLHNAGVRDSQGGRATNLVACVLYNYLLRAPDSAPPAGRKVSFRELREVGPLAVNFADNTHKTIAQTFADRPADLKAAALRLGGRPVAEKHGFDVWVRLNALPYVAIDLQFNGRDEEFPAQCGLAFNQSIEAYLDSRSIFILGTYLTGRLIA